MIENYLMSISEKFNTVSIWPHWAGTKPPTNASLEDKPHPHCRTMETYKMCSPGDSGHLQSETQRFSFCLSLSVTMGCTKMSHQSNSLCPLIFMCAHLALSVWKQKLCFSLLFLARPWYLSFLWRLSSSILPITSHKVFPDSQNSINPDPHHLLFAS